MTTLTHTAALPVIPTNGAGLPESARKAYRKLRSALLAKPRPDVRFDGESQRRKQPEVVCMRFYA